MPQTINISELDIGYAERLLLNEREHFDDERRTFITNFDTIDLNAVPGSGKTTALLAKLIVLDKFLPLNDNSGILVLSHTNAAVEEIKSKLFKNCPKLFSFPNFVGTIQNFIDQFLAIPFYKQVFKTNIVRIDEELYYERTRTYYETTQNYNLKSWLNRKSDPISYLYNVRFDSNLDLIPSLNKSAQDYELKNKNRPTYKGLVNYKKMMMKSGILHYDDAYTLGFIYLIKYPRIKDILQKRFSFIFVDEMQDMDKHQHDILEIIFNNGDNCAIQRIGDKNQAIYNGEISLEEIWSPRTTTFELNGSYRLSPRNARLVKYFGIEEREIEGRKINPDGTPIDIKPHIITFNSDTISRVIPKYSEIIANFINNALIPNNDNNLYYAIAWRKHNPETGKLALTDYFQNYVGNNVISKIDFNSLRDYLVYYDNERKLLRNISNNIINAFLKILRLENIYYSANIFFTKTRLLSFLNENHNDFYTPFRAHLFNWSINTVKGNDNEVFENIKEYIPTFLNVFGKQIVNSADFTNGCTTQQNCQVLEDRQCVNCYYDDINNIKVHVGTIHSVKGCTHTATLYLESNYQQQRDGTAYESQRLASQFKYSQFNDNRVYNKQSARMMYVGLSRPTHLLCFAMDRQRYQQHYTDLNTDDYIVVEA